MKKSKNIVLIVTPVLSAALFNACGSSQPYPVVKTNTPATTPVTTPYPISTVAPQTRDVYSNLNDCVKDWSSKELCEQMSDDDDKNYRSKYKSSGTGKYFYGPQYSSSNRIITYKGKTVTPTGKTTKMPSYVSAVPASKTTGSTTTSSSTTSSVPSTTSKSTTSSTSPTSSTSTYTPSTTTRSGFGTTSSYSSSSGS